MTPTRTAPDTGITGRGARHVIKQAERWVRRRILARLADPIADWPPDRRVDRDLPVSPRILVVRTDRLGDALVTTPLLRALRERFPTGRIDVLLGAKNQVVSPLLPYVDCRVVMRGLLEVSTLMSLRRTHYDIVLNTRLVKSASSTLVCRLVGARILLEYPVDDPWDGSRPEANHVVSMQHRLLAPLGVDPVVDSDGAEFPLQVTIPDASRDKADAVWEKLCGPAGGNTRVVINLSAGSLLRRPSAESLATKQMTEERTAELTRRLRRSGLTPILCSAPPDHDALQRAAALSDGAALVLPPDESYADFAALLDGADAVVSPDTSVIHLAAALGKPTVAMFRSHEWARFWWPWGVPHRLVVRSAGVGAIRSEEVHRAVVALLEDHS